MPFVSWWTTLCITFLAALVAMRTTVTHDTFALCMLIGATMLIGVSLGWVSRAP